MSESTFPWVYSLQFSFKSRHHSWRYERKCEWVFFFWTQCILNDETFSGVSYMIKQTAMRLGAVLEAGRPGHCRRWWHGTNSLWRERSSASNIDEISAAINFHTTRQSVQRVCFRCLARGTSTNAYHTPVSDTRKFNIAYQNHPLLQIAVQFSTMMLRYRWTQNRRQIARPLVPIL